MFIASIVNEENEICHLLIFVHMLVSFNKCNVLLLLTKLIFIDRLILQLKEKPLWFEPQTPPMQVPLESAPCAALEEIEKAETSETRSSYYENPRNREDVYLPMPDHSLQFIHEKENSDSKRYKRLKCSICGRNTHFRCVVCVKAFCKECGYKFHLSMMQ